MGGGGSKVKGNYLLETLGDHRDSINCMAVSEDQSLLATGSEDYTIRMWSTRTDETECLGELKGHTSYITCITICDTFVISGSFDASIRKWDMTTCECVFNFEGHQSRIGRVICSGEFVFSTSYDKTAKAWIFDAEETFDDEMDPDAGRKACIRTFKGHVKGVYSVIFIPAEDQFGVDESGLNINPGDILITGSADFDARSWSFDTSATLRVFKGHKGPITCMSTDPNGTILYTGSQDKDIRSWDIRTGRLLKVMSSHEGPVICLTVVDRLLYSGSQDGHAKCWVREFGDCTKTYRGHKHSIVALKLRDGILYTACGDTIIRAFDATSGAMRRMFQGHEAAVTCMTIIGEKLFSASLDSTLRVWNLKNIQKDPDEGDEEEETPDAAEQSFEKNQTRKLDEVDQRLDGYLSNEFIP